MALSARTVAEVVVANDVNQRILNFPN